LKYASFTGIAAALLLIVFCFIPWAYYPDLHESFTGFYSKQNNYGKPGKTFIFLSVISVILFLLPKIWAKRANQFVCVLTFAYALKTYFIYAACYQGICPEIRLGLFGMLFLSLLILISSLLSKVDIQPKA
jgi:hypothetical protein